MIIDFEYAYKRLSILADEGRNLLTDEDADVIIKELREKDTTIRDLEDKLTSLRNEDHPDYSGLVP